MLGSSLFCGDSWMFSKEKPEQDVFVLHSTMIASLCLRFGRPASYQQGYHNVSNTSITAEQRFENGWELTSVTQVP